MKFNNSGGISIGDETQTSIRLISWCQNYFKLKRISAEVTG